MSNVPISLNQRPGLCRRHAIVARFGLASLSAATLVSADSPPAAGLEVVEVAPADAYARIDTAAAQRDTATLADGTDAERDAVVARVLARPGAFTDTDGKKPPPPARAPSSASVSAVATAPSAELRKQLPQAPAGFDWVLYKNCAVLRPTGWNQKIRPDDPAKNLTGAFALSPEVFSENKYFDHGFTVQIHTDVKRRFGAAASPSLQAFIHPVAAKLKKEDLLLFKEGSTATGATNILRYLDAPPGLTPVVIHRYFIADDANDTIYVFTYEAPRGQWEENWKNFGTPIFQRISILGTSPAP